MMERMIGLLREKKEIADWKIVNLKKRSAECFFVSDKLETTRETDLESYRVTVYVDKDGKRGEATVTCYDYMSDAELGTKLEEGIYSAGFALNEYYEIPGPEGEQGKVWESESNLKNRDFKEVMPKLVEAVFRANDYEDGYLSATEFFLTEQRERIVNSKGVDICQITYGGEVELIPSWGKQEKEVEVYHMLKFEEFQPEKITEEVRERLLLAKARYEAGALARKGAINVIVQDGNAKEVLSYFANELQYSLKYNKIERYEPGDDMQGTGATGTKLNIRLLPGLAGVVGSRYFDRDGVILEPMTVVENGIAKSRHGSFRYGYYLNEKRPTGSLPVLEAEGDTDYEEMKKAPYLRCVEFSGLQVEPNSGYLGGEVRLGYYFDGEKEIPVTGFSISGNIRELGAWLRLSKEKVKQDCYSGPKYVELPNMIAE